jgi:hypothetical protein
MTSFLNRKLVVDRIVGKAISGVHNLNRQEARNDKSGNKIACKDRKLGLAISGYDFLFRHEAGGPQETGKGNIRIT